MYTGTEQESVLRIMHFRRGSVSSVYSKYREASQKRYCGMLMSMLEPSSEPKPKLKGLVLSKSVPPAPASSKLLPVIITSPTVAKVDSTPVVAQRAQKAQSSRPLVEHRSSAPPLSSVFRKSLGFNEVNECMYWIINELFFSYWLY